VPTSAQTILLNERAEMESLEINQAWEVSQVMSLEEQKGNRSIVC